MGVGQDGKTGAGRDLPRPSDDARLVWQCRRGMRELDLLLEGFLADGYHDLDDDGRRDFARLLDYPDQLLFEYLMGKMTPSEAAMQALVTRIRQQARVSR